MGTEVVTYNYIEEHDIHEIIFAESSRKAMDEYIGIIYDIYDEHLKGRSSVRIMLDIHKSGMLPVRYATAIMEKTFKELAPFPKPYVVYLTNNSMDNSLINTMNYTASRKVKRAHFTYDQRDEAIQELLKRG